jgi:protein STE50
VNPSPTDNGPHVHSNSPLLGDVSTSIESQTAPNSKVPGDLSPTPTSLEIFKSFRVGLDDPCYKVLPNALRKYNIQSDWRNYALYIVYGDQERLVGFDEKPMALFKDLDREGKRPMFMLRKLPPVLPTFQPARPQPLAGHTPAELGNEGVRLEDWF